MRSVYEERVESAREIDRTLVQGTARLCVSDFGRCCKAIWPTNTAENLAAEIGCSVRAAAYEIVGDREPSGRSIGAIVKRISRWPL